MSSDYKEALHRILIYLTEDEKEATYTLNCFYNQDEMALAETSTRIAERFHSRMRLKEEAVPEIMAELKYFKNEKFKRRVAELCHWCVLQLDLPSIYERKFPRDLKIFMVEIRRYNRDLKVMGADINRRFKFLSPTPDLPQK